MVIRVIDRDDLKNFQNLKALSMTSLNVPLANGHEPFDSCTGKQVVKTIDLIDKAVVRIINMRVRDNKRKT